MNPIRYGSTLQEMTLGSNTLARNISNIFTTPSDKKHMTLLEDQTSNLYCGINLKWNYDKGYVDFAMPQYVMKQLTHYAHPTPNNPQHCPYSPNPITYGKDNQAPAPANESHHLNNAGKKCIQQDVGSFLYCAHAVNPTILMALSDIATQ
jgi:hypothetical protein